MYPFLKSSNFDQVLLASTYPRERTSFKIFFIPFLSETKEKLLRKEAQ